jgi:hypothetical protein
MGVTETLTWSSQMSLIQETISAGAIAWNRNIQKLRGHGARKKNAGTLAGIFEVGGSEERHPVCSDLERLGAQRST